MLFSSIPFLFYFLPPVLLVYFLLPAKGKNAFLLLASLFFYAWGESAYVILMVISIALFYCFGLLIEKSVNRKKLWLTMSILTGAGLLAVFKYADFGIENWNHLTGMSIPLLKLALPIGISFYTFQCISYTADVYRGQVPAQKNPISFGAYVALFPQLIAGPIVRYADIARELENRETHWADVSGGLFLFLVGLGKKILLANAFGELTEIFRVSEEKSLLFYWLYALGFTLHIYFDFSGYSDMAVGLGRIFGFHFPRNFNYPYIAGSVTEFWRRWHMTLSQWFRDYVYIPMGGNRVSKGRWVINILTVWMLTGLWHGAAWNFILWGLMFALLLLIEKWISGFQKLPPLLRHGYVLLTVIISFVIFNAADLSQAWQDLQGMFGGLQIPLATQEAWYYLRSYGFLLLLGILGATPIVRNLAVYLAGKGWDAVLRPVAAVLLLLVCTGYLVDGSFNPFLYFRF